MQEIDRREQRELNPPPKPQPTTSSPIWSNQFSTVTDTLEARHYPDTTKGRIHRAYDEEGLSGAIKLARNLGIPSRRFKRWLQDFRFFEEFE